MTQQKIVGPPEQIDELENDLEILRRVQALNDTDKSNETRCAEDSDGAEQTLKELEQHFVSEIETSALIAMEITEALSPLLHHDDPDAIKDGFAQLVAWRQKQKANRGPRP